MKLFKDRPLSGWLLFGLVMVLYYALFVRPFFAHKFMTAGDTYGHWSLKYMILYSLKHFGTLPWWDPTMYNGYPLYYHFLSGWSNYLGPFYVLFLAFFKAFSWIPTFTVNNTLLFHETVYVPALVAAAVYLICRQMLTHPAARVLPVFIFCFSYFPLLNFHDFYTFEAMVAPLFFLYALVRFNNHRTPKNLLIFLFFTAVLSASLCNGIMMSAFFWTVIFSVLLLATDLGLLKSIFRTTGELSRSLRGRTMLILGVLLIASGLFASYLPVHFNSGRVLVYRGGQVSYSQESKFTNAPIPIEKSKIWTVLSNWLPFPEYQSAFLDYGWKTYDRRDSGHVHRYIGIVTIPLALLALVYFRSRYLLPLLLTYLICNCFIIYSTKNLAYMVLVDNSDFFRNFRNITSIFSRGGGLIFLILLAGVGLDSLLKNSPLRLGGNFAGRRSFLDKRNLVPVILLMILTAAGIGLIMHWSELVKYETFFHIGWYLIIFSLLFYALLRGRQSRMIQRGCLIAVFILTFLDLTVSASRYIDVYARKPWSDEAAIGDYAAFLPVRPGDEPMFPKGYIGIYHNTGGRIYWGMKEWLVLATDKKRQRILSNYNPETACMTEYPSVHFFDKEVHRSLYGVDFIASPDYIKNFSGPGEQGGAVYIESWADLLKYTFNDVVIRANTRQNGFLYFRDNYDRFWSARLNGKKADILRADFTFKAVSLPAGDNVVEFTYDPYPVKAAYGIFYLLMFIFAGVYAFSRRLPGID